MDGELPDTFDVLCGKIASSRGREAVEFASMTVGCSITPARPNRFTAAVVIDGRRVGNLTGPRPGRYAVEPGKHEIVVYFATSRIWPVGLDRSTRQSLTLTLMRGEEVELGCGMRPAWVVFETEARKSRWPNLGYSLLLLAIAWFVVYPFLRELIPRIVDRWKLEGVLVWLMYRIVDRRMSTVFFCFIMWILFIDPLITRRRRRRMVEIRRQFVGLYYLEEKRRLSPKPLI